MPLKVITIANRKTYYLRGTVSTSLSSEARSVYESTGIRVGSPNALRLAEEIRLRREKQIYQELIHGPESLTTFAEAAAAYARTRHERRKLEDPQNADLPDKEVEYVLKWATFFRSKGVADIPLREFLPKCADLIAEYFQVMHAAKGNKLSTMRREANVYCAVMSFAADQKMIGNDYPKPKLPNQDVLNEPINKWLYEREIDLFYKLAPAHLRMFVAGLFATGIRGGELIFVSRRAPTPHSRTSTGLILESGHEAIHLGRTKNGAANTRSLPDWYVRMLNDYLAKREDSHDALFLTHEGKPYTRPRRQRGFIVKTAWKNLRSRVAALIERLARLKDHQGNDRDAARLRGRASYVMTVTPHWGRHNVASHMTMNGSPDHEVQLAGGWRTAAMVKRYQHLAPEHVKKVANNLGYDLSDLRAKPVHKRRRGGN